MADEEAVCPAQNPLVAVTFQRNTKRTEKYLEAEPKALGITQIGLTGYMIIGVAIFQAQGLGELSTDIPFFIASLLVIIAGNVAIVAKNLNLSTLRACMGLQIVACGASVFNVICIVIKMDQMYYCWRYYHDDESTTVNEICHQITKIHSHFYAGGVLIQVTVLAISVTLVTYACKVVNCCGPAPKIPVISIQTPPANSVETPQMSAQE